MSVLPGRGSYGGSTLTWWLRKIVGRLAYYVCWPIWWLLLYRTRRTRVFIIAEGRILLIKGMLSGGSWSLPGGGVHRGEDVALSAAREVKEEVGVKIDPAELKELGTVDNVGGFRYETVGFVIYLNKLPTVSTSYEVLEYVWQPLTSLDETAINPVVRTLYQSIKQPEA